MRKRPFIIWKTTIRLSTHYRDMRMWKRHCVMGSEWGQGPSFTQPAGMLSNPPQHTYYRRLVQPAFTPGAIGDLAPRIERLAHDLLDKVADGSRIDIHDDYAFPLPVIIISELLGVPEEDIHLFKDWSDASVEAMGAEDPTPWAAKLQALTDWRHRQMI